MFRENVAVAEGARIAFEFAIHANATAIQRKRDKMHAIDLAELATTYVRLAPAQLSSRQAPNPKFAQEYWLTARYRHENWMHELTRHRDAIQRPGTSRRVRLWQEIMPIMQEILISETLARTLAYQATVLEELNICCELSPVANSTLAAHVEARQRCLHLIVFGQGLSVEDAVKLNRIRRILEQTTDQLLAILLPIDNPGLYCFEFNRFHRMQSWMKNSDRNTTWTTLHAGLLSESFWEKLHPEIDWRAGNARLNHQLSRQVLGLIPAASFDGHGVPYSCAMGRITTPSPEATLSGQVVGSLLGVNAESSLQRMHGNARAPHRRLDEF